MATLGTPERAQAGHGTNIAYDSQTVMHLDVTNTTAGSSRISSNISGTAAFVALNTYPVRISRPDGMLGRTMYTTSNCAGVAGACKNAMGGNGVMGAAKSATGTPVYGFASSVAPSIPAPGGAGVYGSGPTHGLYGTTTNGIGAVGRSTGSFGVYGRSPGGVVVLGESDTVEGVFGISASGIGVRASSTSNWAVYGRSQNQVEKITFKASRIGEVKFQTPPAIPNAPPPPATSREAGDLTDDPVR